MSRQLLLLTAVGCLVICSVASKAPRIFSEDFIEGLYGRFFEFTDKGNTARCPMIIDHFNRGRPSALGNSWIIPHDKIVQQGAKCNDGGVLSLNSFDEHSPIPDVVKENEIAEKTFALMRDDSTGFWMGADSRTCGRWEFPNPTYVFFVREFDRVINSFFNLELAPGKKYMFVVAPTFTCIYEDVTRQTPPPNVIIDAPVDGNAIPPGGQPTDGTESDSVSDTEDGSLDNRPTSTTTEPTSTPSASSEPSTSSPSGSDGDNAAEGDPPVPGSASGSATPVPSSDDNDGTEQGDREPPSNDDGELSIIDVAGGAQPPVQSPEEDDISILDIAGDAGDGSDSDDDTSDSEDDPAESGEDGDSDGDDDDSVFEIDDEEANSVEAQAGDSLCFAGDAIVELRSGAYVRMSELAVGDEVLVGSQVFSTVFTFTHRMAHRMALFVELDTRCGKKLHLTPGHMIYSNDRLVQAGNVRKGDVLRTGEGTRTEVTRVAMVRRRGIYNPQTLHGDIVVNGIVASTFTTTVEARVAQGLLAPVRAWWNLANADALGGRLEEHGSPNSPEHWFQPSQTRVEL